MLVSKLLERMDVRGTYADAQAMDVTDDSRRVRKGTVFVCICGAHFDGHSAALQAEENGAVLIVAERDTGAKNQVLVENTRKPPMPAFARRFTAILRKSCTSSA